MRIYLIAAALVPAGSLLPPSASAQSDFVTTLRAGCAKGSAQDCANLGGQLKLGVTMGRGKPQDLAEARAAFEKGCALGHPAACVEYYIALSIGEGGPRDSAKAKAIEPKACNTGIIGLQVQLKQHGLCIRP